MATILKFPGPEGYERHIFDTKRSPEKQKEGAAKLLRIADSKAFERISEQTPTNPEHKNDSKTESGRIEYDPNIPAEEAIKAASALLLFGSEPGFSGARILEDGVMEVDGLPKDNKAKEGILGRLAQMIKRLRSD